MKHAYAAKAALSLMALTWAGGAALAQAGKVDDGREEFLASCAVCHGIDAKGNGPYTAFLRGVPSDLTGLTKRNGGVFPVGRIYETIEGANVPSHGSREMPVWGSYYRAQSRDFLVGPSPDRERYVRTRILTLIDYINRVQER